MSDFPKYIIQSDKPKQLQKLINEALYIISKLGVPLEGMTHFSYQLSVISYQLSVISYQLSVPPGTGRLEILNFLFSPYLKGRR